MTENLVITAFEVPSEAYQALSELKKDLVNDNYVVSQACIIKNDGRITAEDGFDTGVETRNDTLTGGLVGSIVGILGGPLGVLLGGSMGMLMGGTIDAGDAVENASLIEEAAKSVPEGKTAILALVQEENSAAYDQMFSKYAVTITRQDAAEVAEEVEKAAELQRQMAKDARKKLREEKTDEIKASIANRRDSLKESFENLKNKFKK